MVASQPSPAPESIPLNTDRIVATRMMAARDDLAARRGRKVQWWEVLQELLDCYETTGRQQ